MTKALKNFREVYVVGTGLHPYQYMSATPYVTLGLQAIRAALDDAKVAWNAVESAHIGTALLGMAPGRAMLRYLGATGLPLQQVENASASGSTAFRQAVLEVAAGFTDMSLALGIDKPALAQLAPGKAGIKTLDRGRVAPMTHFALLAQNYINDHGATAEDFARVVAKNSRNGARNPFAQKQKELSVAEVLDAPPLSGVLTKHQCCPVGEGAAAVIVASGEALDKYGIDRSRAVRVLSSSLASESLYENASNFDAELTATTTRRALQDAEVAPGELDVIELHDAFSVEELFYLEAMGVCGPGEAPALLKEGAFDIGGRCAVSPSGGLLRMGHPIGPTGVGQVVEVARQLRGEAGDRQQPKARYGLAHMVGIGAVCAVHVLGKD